MPYYDTIEEDLARAKEILEKGKADIPEGVAPEIFGVHAMGGTIYGADTFAAYKLLESFVEEVERKKCAMCKQAPTLALLYESGVLDLCDECYRLLRKSFEV
jgi:hypothetical protein